jgi:colicin import membrane protein
MHTMTRQSGGDIEPGKLRAALLSLLIHAAFLVLLVFGLNWKNEIPETVMVDLWSDMPQPIKPLPPVEKVTPKSEPVKAKSEPRPVIETAPPPTRKPAIAFKEKVEKPLPKEDIKKPEPVKKEIPKAEPVKKVEQKAKKEDEAQQKTEAQRKAKQREQEMAALKAEQTRMMDEIAKYKAMIQAKIRSRIVMPPDLPGNPVAEFRVTLLPGGDVLGVTLRKSSGYTAFDESIERAIFLAKPLPLPPDPNLFREFRDFSLTVYYRE